jgi:hypothetical protein
MLWAKPLYTLFEFENITEASSIMMISLMFAQSLSTRHGSGTFAKLVFVSLENFPEFEYSNNAQPSSLCSNHINS